MDLSTAGGQEFPSDGLKWIGLLQAGQGFLSDVQNMGMYAGEMQDGQPHGRGTIGK